MNSICFFACYFDGNKLPYYISVYLSELKKYFKEVIIIVHQDLDAGSRDFLAEKSILTFITKNEGYDFGSWYKAIQQFDISRVDKILFVNDSTVLFKSLEGFMQWSEKNDAEIQGMTLSEAIFPHVQSYFFLVKKPAIGTLKAYFDKHKIRNSFQDVIQTYEIGLSKELQSKGFRITSLVDNNGYKGEFSPYFQCLEHHLSQGIPLIKKKILFTSYRKDELFTLARMNFKISEQYYISLIKKYNSNLIIDFEKLQKDRANGLTELEKLRYRLNCAAIRLLRPVYKSVRNA